MEAVMEAWMDKLLVIVLYPCLYCRYYWLPCCTVRQTGNNSEEAMSSALLNDLG
jgi:hypothetical protein